MATRDGTKTGGRVAGTPNKVTRTVKETFAQVFSDLQDDNKANLGVWAREYPTEFYKLSSKLLPIQLAGDADNPVAVNVVQGMTFEQLYQLKYQKKPE